MSTWSTNFAGDDPAAIDSGVRLSLPYPVQEADQELDERRYRSTRDWLSGALMTPLSDSLRLVIGVRAMLPWLLQGARLLRLESPTWMALEPIAHALGVKTELLTTQALLQSIPVDDEVVTWITHPGRNPDGLTLGDDEVRGVDAAAGAGARLVVNETYRMFVPEAARPTLAVRVGSLRKLLGPAAGIGWYEAACTEWQLPWLPTSWEGLHLLERAVAHGAFRQHCESVVSRVIANVKVFQACGGNRFTVGNEASLAGPCRLIKVGDLDGGTLQEELRRLGYVTNCGAAFGASDAVRVYLGSTLNSDGIIDLVETLELVARGTRT